MINIDRLHQFQEDEYNDSHIACQKHDNDDRWRPDGNYVTPHELSKEDVAKLLADKTISPKMLSGSIFCIEFLAVLLVGLLCLQAHSVPLSAYGVVLGLSAFYVIFAQGLNLYQMDLLREPTQQLIRCFIGWISCFAGLTMTSYLIFGMDFFDRSWLTPWFITGFGSIMALRFLTTNLARKWTKAGLLERRAVIIGGGKNAEDVITQLEQQQNNDIRICGIFDDRDDVRSPKMIAGYPKLGTVPELIDFARAARLDMLIVTLPLTAGGRVREMLKKLWILPVDIRLSAHSNKMAFRARNYSYIGAMPFVRLADKPINGWHFVRKRIFDAIMSALLLVLLTPLMLATALFIKLDSKGPVFFRQKRHGFNNEVIDVWKFRSMYADKCDAKAKVVVVKDDPRVTRVGAFIRKTSIDELPQLWNVLKGELSLVGPRPHAVHAHLQNQPWNEVVDGYFARHRVKPGVTGWAQINGWRGEVDNVEKIKKRTDYDLHYIENWSLAFDLYILVMTPFKLMNTENAY